MNNSQDRYLLKKVIIWPNYAYNLLYWTEIIIPNFLVCVRNFA